MEDLYIRVGWPEYQEYQQCEGFDEHNFYDAVNNQCFIERKWAHTCRLNKQIVGGKSDLDEAIAYILKNHQWTDAEEQCALDGIGAHRNLPQFIETEIYDLLEEYGEDNDLPEGWWMEYGDIDDIFLKLR